MSDSTDDILSRSMRVEDDLSDDAAAENSKSLALAITNIVENIVRKELRDTLPARLEPLIEQSLKELLPEALPGLVASALPDLANEQLLAMTPPLVESAIAGQQEVIKETVEDVARHTLPGLIGPIMERLSKDILQQEVRKLLDTTGQEIVEKVAWEVVPVHAEIEVRREIERLTAQD
jgi:hypothetical protein